LLALLIVVLASLGALVLVANQHAAAQHQQPKTHTVAANNASPLPADDPALDCANGLSKAFRNASGSVLPSVVTIQRTAVVQTNTEPSPRDQGSDNRGHQQQPFGDLFNGPFFKRFFGDNVGNYPIADFELVAIA
jgi:hypothetical protein